MRFLLTLLAITSLASAHAQLSSLAWPALDTELPLWKPTEIKSQPNKTWPAIIYYHGTNGRPTVQLLRIASASKDFVLVGMTYTFKGRFPQSDENIASERLQLDQLKRLLVSDHQVDPQRIYIAGFSKGGWLTATLLERDHSLAGGLILGAGIFHNRNQKAQALSKPFKTKKPIFLGVGRYDGNYPQSLAALLHFRKLGAQVTLEAWPDTEHAFPTEEPPGLQQWLSIHAGNYQEQAEKWTTQRQQAIAEITDPVAQWYAWKTFQERPFTKALDLDMAPALTKLEQDPEVLKEKAFEESSRNILRRELKDRYVTTLERVLKRYEDLAHKAKGRPAGKVAEKDASRVQRLLGP